MKLYFNAFPGGRLRKSSLLKQTGTQPTTNTRHRGAPSMSCESRTSYRRDYCWSTPSSLQESDLSPSFRFYNNIIVFSRSTLTKQSYVPCVSAHFSIVSHMYWSVNYLTTSFQHQSLHSVELMLPVVF